MEEVKKFKKENCGGCGIRLLVGWLVGYLLGLHADSIKIVADSIKFGCERQGEGRK